MNPRSYKVAQRLQASHAFTALTQLPEPIIQTNKATYLRIDIDVTAVGTAAPTYTVQAWDEAKGDFVDTPLVTAALSSTGHKVLLIGPDVTTASNAALQALLPEKIKLKKGGTITDTITLSISCVQM